MKKVILFVFLLLGLILPVSAQNVMPEKICPYYTNTIGLYQASHQITLYKSPDEKSPIVHSIRWTNEEVFPNSLTHRDLFVAFSSAKNLALMAVTDDTDDWVEVIYNNTTGARGWMKKDDPYKFLSWINFYNMYGRKYGLYILKGSPDSINNLHASPENDSQIVARLNISEGVYSKINLNVIRGNWALISVMDMDRTPKTGYIRWRGDDGVKYLFPDMR